MRGSPTLRSFCPGIAVRGGENHLHGLYERREGISQSSNSRANGFDVDLRETKKKVVKNMDKRNKLKWEVRQAESLDYVMSCPCCGYSFIRNEITVKNICPGCGTVLADGNRTLRSCRRSGRTPSSWPGSGSGSKRTGRRRSGMDEQMKKILLKQAQLIQEECERRDTGSALYSLSMAMVAIAKVFRSEKTVNLDGDQVAEHVQKAICDKLPELQRKS